MLSESESSFLCCSDCIESNLPSVCPTCHIPSHVHDIQSNRQLSSAVQLCQELKRLLLKPAASNSIGEVNRTLFTPRHPTYLVSSWRLQHFAPISSHPAMVENWSQLVVHPPGFFFQSLVAISDKNVNITYS